MNNDRGGRARQRKKFAEGVKDTEFDKIRRHERKKIVLEALLYASPMYRGLSGLCGSIFMNLDALPANF